MVKMSALKGVRGLYRLRVRYRLMVLAYAMAHGPTAAARRYGVGVRTVRRWRVRWRAEGLAGLVPRYPHRRASNKRREVLEHIRHARESLGYGAARTRLWLLRTHHVRLAMGTIQRAFRDLGLPYLCRTRKPPRRVRMATSPRHGQRHCARRVHDRAEPSLVPAQSGRHGLPQGVDAHGQFRPARGPRAPRRLPGERRLARHDRRGPGHRPGVHRLVGVRLQRGPRSSGPVAARRDGS